jgi:hypothetical protein
MEGYGLEYSGSVEVSRPCGDDLCMLEAKRMTAFNEASIRQGNLEKGRFQMR